MSRTFYAKGSSAYATQESRQPGVLQHSQAFELRRNTPTACFNGRPSKNRKD